MLLNVLNRYVETTTYHGIKDWYKAFFNTASKILKIFWSIVLLIAIIAVIVYTYLLVVQYSQGNTASKITPVAVDKMHFPNVSISIAGRFNKTYIKNSVYVPPQYVPGLGVPLDTFKTQFFLYIDLVTNNVVYVDGFTESVVHNLEMMYQNMFNKTVNASAADFVAYLKNASFSCKMLLTRCLMDSEEFDCCAGNEMVTFMDYGAVYQLKLPQLDTKDGLNYQSRPGVTGGLKLYVETKLSDILVTDKMEAFGFRFHFTDYPTGFDLSAVHVPVGMQAMVRINAKQYNYDPAVSNCATDPPPLVGTTFYSKSFCQSMCLFNMTINVCNCLPFTGSLISLPNVEYCPPLMMLTCVLPLITGSTSDALLQLDKTSNCITNNCPTECNYWIYEPSVTYGKLSQTGSSNGTISSMVSVFYGELSYEMVEELLLMDTNTFISNIGNIAGLFTGVSVLSFVQWVSVCLFPKRKIK